MQMKQLTFNFREFNKEYSSYFMLDSNIGTSQMKCKLQNQYISIKFTFIRYTFLETSHISCGRASTTNSNESSFIATPKTCCTFSLLVLSSFVGVLSAIEHKSNDYKNVSVLL